MRLGKTKITFHRAVACDVTGGMASLNFDATELKFFLWLSWKPK